MQSDFLAANQIQDLLERSRSTHEDIYKQWCQIGTALAEHRDDSRGHAFEHLDGNVDLILRMLEADQLLVIQETEKMLTGGVLFIQISLSKMWLFSVYEMVRMNCDFKPCEGKNNKADYCIMKTTCFRCKLRTVRDRLSFFRVPLAKLEPESSRRKLVEQNYQAETVIDNDNGSVGWKARSNRLEKTETTSRLALSNFILETLK